MYGTGWPIFRGTLIAMSQGRFKRILIACNSRGRMLDICLGHQAIRERIWGILSDRESESLAVAEHHGLDRLLQSEGDDAALSDQLLTICLSRNVDFILSTGYTRIFKGAFVEAYRGRILNTHFSLLPAFPGTKGSDWTTRLHPARAIFERAITYGSRIIGNTIHLVDKSIDGGYPVMQSSLAVPYDEPVVDVRHRLFVHECRMFMQTVMWLAADRLVAPVGAAPRIADARFDSPTFSPAIEESWIATFDPASQS
jgi:phosphoribosylglycinamide formyltransferase 1